MNLKNIYQKQILTQRNVTANDQGEAHIIVGGVNKTGNAKNTSHSISSREVFTKANLNRNMFMGSGAYLENLDLLVVCGGYSGSKRMGPFIKTEMESF